MSLENQVKEHVAAANKLTNIISGKIKEIDQKVDVATRAVEQKIRSDMDTVVYVDSENGNDNNSGLTEALAKKRVFSAIVSTPPNSSVEVRLIKGADHVLNERTFLKGRKVIIRSHRSNYADPGTFATLKQGLFTQDNTFMGGQLIPGYGGFIRFDSLFVETATVPSLEYETGKTINNYRSSFVSAIDGFGNVIVKDAKVKINNVAFMHQHESGAIGMLDLILVNSDVTRTDQSAAPASQRRQYLIDQYTVGAVPFSFIVASNVSHNAESWGALIRTSTSLMTTNVTI